MSNTLIAWAAFYPVLRVAFGGQPDGAGKSSEALNFPDFYPACLATRQATLTLLAPVSQVKTADCPLLFLVKTVA
ncbi:hypothetical protein [Pseudomonas fluorescens]|uniref:hypothetical protein n=1 Tax=Pseudomonas fluorescens TaxID=294 RepID=UPI001240B770|nr:hypothetical protein [Pseudomonas fluorescens]